MKAIDAVWEKRNLGVSCIELHIEAADTADDIVRLLDSIEEAQYMVAKIPSYKHDAVRLIQERGYSFAETAINLTNDLRKFQISERLLKICSRCSFAPMNDDDIARLYSEIDKNIFNTDRVYLDPHFTAEQAANRYKGWVSDLIAAGDIPYKTEYNGEQVGFFLNRETSSGVYDGILAGVYKQYEGSGMGLCVQYSGLALAMQAGAQKYLGHISANNPAVMRVLASLGFEISNIDYVFVKHND